ncbi:4'-phosphopantetheinyl transferase family protein [Paraburkholderia caballeronis]|uniref:4'-phosphopantetheinyl transferase family protein n=1 Tax=Paraburkholderia caballeronis TaxID=416943 RepID=UPI00141704D2|nr:4'-phosphopantetheinyl transferase superfamily protein [Paraburkholderia caballeronis]
MASRGRWPVDVDVWQVRLALSAREENCPHLDDAERARAARYRAASDRVRFATTRSVLRELLGHYTDTSADSLRFVLSAAGKPRLPSSDAPRFNVSHSGEQALIAVSRTREVGIDIELADAGLDWRELVGLVCTDAERAALESVPPPLQHAQFFRCWTAKEAALKALGIGITDGLRVLTIDLDSETSVRPQAGMHPAVADANRLTCHWLDDVHGYAACVAYGPEVTKAPDLVGATSHEVSG